MASIELLTIGTELLLGLTLDTNSAELGRALAGAGLRVVRRTTVGDDPATIHGALSEALGRTGLVLCTGGLGPTADDVTKKVAAELFGMPLEFQEPLWAALVERFARFGRVPAERNRTQALVPRGATVLPNRWGTAPGLWLEGGPGVAILLPGVPAEMRGLLRHEVLPRLASRAGGLVVRSRTVRTTGIPESSLAERLEDIEHEIEPLSLAYLPGVLGVDLRLTAWNLSPGDAEARLDAAAEELARRAGAWVYGRDDDDLAAVVLERLRGRGWKLVTAESCTGGGIGMRLTEVPGSSDCYLGGVIAYDNRVKQEQLDVPDALLQEHGAVSEVVAAAMALGVSRRLGAETALAVTGIAGPGGGTAEKPVGLVYAATVVEGVVDAVRLNFPGNRSEIRARAGQMALFLLERRLRPGPSATAPGPTV